MARGRFGGSLSKRLVTVSVDVPINLRLRLDADELAKRVGQKVAAKIRRQLKKGTDYEGNVLPAPKDGKGGALNRTGRLIASIKFRKDTATVEPTGKRDDVSRRASGNYGIMAIQIQVRDIDPLGTLGGALDKDLVELTEQEIDRQLEKGSAGLLGELKRSFRGR